MPKAAPISAIPLARFSGGVQSAMTAAAIASIREHATVVFPAEAYAEKEGTLVHPDGRLQRLRAAIGRPRGMLAGWQAIAEVAQRTEGSHRRRSTFCFFSRVE